MFPNPTWDENEQWYQSSKFCHNKNLVVKNIVLAHQNIHNYTWTSPVGKIRNQIEDELRDKRWYYVYSMQDISEEMTVILTTLWRLQIQRENASK